MEQEERAPNLVLDTEQWEGGAKWLNWKHSLEQALPYDCEMSLFSDPESFRGHLEVLCNPKTGETYSDVSYSGNQVRRTKEHISDGYADYVLMFIKSGEGSFQSEGNIYWLKPNTIYLVDTAKPFSKDMYGDCSVVLIRIAEEHIRPALTQMNSQAVFTINSESTPGILLRNYLFMLPQAVHTATDETIDFLFRALTNLVTANLIETSAVNEQLPSSTNRAFYLQVLKFMRQRCTEANFRMSHLVAHYQLSRSFLYQLFKAHGTTFSNELRNLRIELATHRLATGPEKLADLAYEVGFNGVSQFSRAFRTEMGVTPQQFRKSQL